MVKFSIVLQEIVQLIFRSWSLQGWDEATQLMKKAANTDSYFLGNRFQRRGAGRFLQIQF